MMEAHVKELNRSRDSASQLTLASLVESGLQEKKAHSSPQKAAGVDSYSTKTKEGEISTSLTVAYWFHIRMLGGISLCLIPLTFAVAGTQFASMYPTFWVFNLVLFKFLLQFCFYLFMWITDRLLIGQRAGTIPMLSTPGTVITLTHFTST
jgi:hypothetical protein